MLLGRLLLATAINVAWVLTSKAADVNNTEQIAAQKLMDAGLKNYHANQFKLARQVWEHALNSFEAIGDEAGKAQALGNLGIVYRRLGEYSKAVDTLLNAQKIVHALNDFKQENRILINLGNAYEVIGQYQDAISNYQHSAAISANIKDWQTEALALNNIGGIYANQGNYPEAVKLYEQSQAIAEAHNDLEGRAYCLNNLGSAYHEMAKFDQAKVFLEDGVALAKKLGLNTLLADTRINLGLLFEDNRDYAAALSQYHQALVVSQQINDPKLSAAIQNNIGHALLDSGKPADAEFPLRTAILNLDSLRQGMADLNNVSLFDTQVMTYNLLQQVLVAQKHYELALEISEQGRARALIELLTDRAKNKPELANANYLTGKQIKAIAKKLDTTLVEYSIVPVDEFKVRGKLRGKAGKLYIWVVKPDGRIHFRQLDLAKENFQFDDLIATTRDSMGLRGAGRISAEPEKTYQNVNLKRFYRYLIDPITDLLPTDPEQKITFIPQDTLYMVPFAALQNNLGKSLIEAHTFSTASSVKVLNVSAGKFKIRPKYKGVKAVVIGNPSPMPSINAIPGQPLAQLSNLPGSEQEAVDIAKILHTKPIIGANATKANILPKLQDASVIHFATHGLLNTLKPREMPGAIALAVAGKDDGLLTAQDISKLHLTAELAVLSACDTGGGEITGDGIIGLSRALVAAGIPSSIVTLWKIPDISTSYLMTAFYNHWVKSHDNAKALRYAILKTKAQYPDPISWAGFVLMGAM
jgi:CHAT domain-containing protein